MFTWEIAKIFVHNEIYRKGLHCCAFIDKQIEANGKYAVEHGNVAAAKNLSGDFENGLARREYCSTLQETVQGRAKKDKPGNKYINFPLID